METVVTEMPYRQETDPARTITLLSVSPFEEDHLHLHEIVDHCEWPFCPDSDCIITACPGLAAARDLLRQHRFRIVVCERDLLPGTWRDLLEHLLRLPDPPLLIVTSRLADDYLWAEALNLGAYDVLAKPFVPAEVIRTLSLAWLHWRDRHETHDLRPEQRMAAAG